MNRTVFRLLFLILMMLVLGGCSDKEKLQSLSIEPSTLSFGCLAAESKAEVISTQDWSAEISDGNTWCQVSPATSMENATIKITVQTNPSQVKRTATIRFVGKKGSEATLAVEQDGIVQTDSYTDEEVRVYEINRQTNPVNLVFMGDGFIQEDFSAGGAFDQAVQEGVEALFAVEPYKSYRQYFNIYKIAAFSKERGGSHRYKNIIKNTVFSTNYESEYSSGITTNVEKVFSYAGQIPFIDLDNTGIFLILNDSTYGGTTTMYSSGRSVAICPMDRHTELPGGFGPILIHEGGGHGFGRLADEYTDAGGSESTAPDAKELEELKAWFSFGYYANIDILNDLTSIKWKDFIGKPGYEAVGAFEGGYTHSKGIWRPEEISCMNDNRPYFNAPSRAAIVKRILTIAGEPFTLERFIEKDVQKVPDAKVQVRSANKSNLPRLSPPIMIRN